MLVFNRQKHGNEEYYYITQILIQIKYYEIFIPSDCILLYYPTNEVITLGYVLKYCAVTTIIRS